ncbi:MAG: hypothetical protein RIC85_00445 [Gammaproteobacteria bacterium]
MSDTYESHVFDWRGSEVEIRYNPRYARKRGQWTAHLDISGESSLPITQTGFKHRFAFTRDVEDQGGPVHYVRAWLDRAALTPQEKRAMARQDDRQGELF